MNSLQYHLIHKTEQTCQKIYKIGLACQSIHNKEQKQLAEGDKVDTGHQRAIHHGWQTGRHAGLVHTHV